VAASGACEPPRPLLCAAPPVEATWRRSASSASRRCSRAAKKLRASRQATTPLRVPLACMRAGVSCMSANWRATCGRMWMDVHGF
jgi:hypothetical protein